MSKQSEAFLAPYQFVSVTGKVDGEHTPTTDFGKIAGGDAPFVRHDRWDDDSYSGRLVATMTTVTPTVLGAEQTAGTDEQVGEVQPYRAALPGKPLAVPGSALRGMLGTIAETISQSALRRLENSTHKVRVDRHKEQCRSTHDYFAAIDATNPNLLPWGEGERDALTPAEQIFGVVESQRKEGHTTKRSLASRVRFADALPLKDVELLARKTLKILASPKPPSPAMYFHQRGGGYVEKRDLMAATARKPPLPNGRKFYLHSREQDVKAETWVSDSPLKDRKQKLAVQPVKAEASFAFHIDFDNLSEAELILLCASLDPDWAVGGPCEYLHRIGLGKPLGLGSVELKLLGVFRIDRQRRYALDALDGLRYHQLLCPRKLSWNNDLVARYPLEAEAMKELEAEQLLPEKDELIDRSSLMILRVIGSRKTREGELPVCYPYSTKKGQWAHSEGEGFHWFVENNRNRQYLALDDEQPPKLKTLYAGQSVVNTAHKGGYLGRRGNESEFSGATGQLFIAKLPPVRDEADCEELEEEVRSAFEAYGPVTRVLLKDNQYRRAAFGFVTLAADACDAAKNSGVRVRGKELVVKDAIRNKR